MKYLSSKLVNIVLVSVLFIFTLTACSSNESESDYPVNNTENDTQSDTYDEESDSSHVDELMTADRAKQIYNVYVDHSYETYKVLGKATWDEKDAEERSLMYTNFCNIAQKLGLNVNTSESEWVENMDWSTNLDDLFSSALEVLDPENSSQLKYLQSVYTYQKGLSDGKFEPLNEKILATADNLQVEHNRDTYLLCVGEAHNIQQMTYEWATQEASFLATGSVTVVNTDDIFTDVSASYYISGQNGIFESAKFGTTDFLPIFKSIGATDEGGSFLTKQIDICAVNVFDAEILYILSREELGNINIAVVVYDEAKDKYVWDNQTYITRDRCCFNLEGEFYYVDNDGNLQNLTKLYTGGA